MKYLLDAREMKAVDEYTIKEIKIPSMVLMERAALSVALEAAKHTVSALPVLCICGCGNNGADGLAAARILKEQKIPVAIYIPMLTENPSQEWKAQNEIIKNLSIPIVNNPIFSEYTLLIDAIFGVGLNREVTGEYKSCIEAMNASQTPIMAVDIPSGLDSSTGKILGTAVKANWTVTFGVLKIGLLLYPGAEFCGEVIQKEIGFPQEVIERVSPSAFTYELSDLEKIPPRKPYSNKGTYGKVLLVAGSENMAGAAYLSAKAAYATGAGLVKIVTCEENRIILQSSLPEAIMATYHKENWEEVLEPALEWADVIAVGPGLSIKEVSISIVESILAYGAIQKEKTIIFDADALNILSKNRERFHALKGNGIITPHLGEMARLTGKRIEEIQDTLIQTAKNFSEAYGVVCVLKDARTIVSDRGMGAFFINSSGNNGMATGGAGDVLTGIIAGLSVMKLENQTAACLGVYIHGLAGDIARKEKGTYAMGAKDIICGLEKVFQELDKNLSSI